MACQWCGPVGGLARLDEPRLRTRFDAKVLERAAERGWRSFFMAERKAYLNYLLPASRSASRIDYCWDALTTVPAAYIC